MRASCICSLPGNVSGCFSSHASKSIWSAPASIFSRPAAFWHFLVQYRDSTLARRLRFTFPQSWHFTKSSHWELATALANNQSKKSDRLCTTTIGFFDGSEMGGIGQNIPRFERYSEIPPTPPFPASIQIFLSTARSISSALPQMCLAPSPIRLRRRSAIYFSAFFSKARSSLSETFSLALAAFRAPSSSCSSLADKGAIFTIILIAHTSISYQQ